MIKLQKIEYFDEEVLLEATVACNEAVSRKQPVVFIFHAWSGKDQFVEDKAKALAELGYIGCALDVYGKGILGKSKEANAALMTPFLEDRIKLQRRLLAYQSLLPKIPNADSSKLGAIGFCFGGLCALDLARSGADIEGVVSFHGLLQDAPSIKATHIKAKILALHGHDDPMVTAEDVLSFEKEMTLKKVDWQFHAFGGAMHAFTNPEAHDLSFGTVYHSLADRRSWNLMKQFFQEVFL